jgi:glycosyltransferase involved in cell wall biosynthesis
MEAQAAGVWPVCFNVSDGVRELIARKGRRGTLVRPYSERAYARKLSKLMDNPQMLAEARPALKESTRKYDIKKITMDWERFLHFIY